MSDTIFIDDPNTMFVPREEIEDGWIKHVNCNGARFHTLMWNTIGTQCSEEKCIINKRYEEAKKKRTQY